MIDTGVPDSIGAWEAPAFSKFKLLNISDVIAARAETIYDRDLGGC